MGDDDRVTVAQIAERLRCSRSAAKTLVNKAELFCLRRPGQTWGEGTFSWSEVLAALQALADPDADKRVERMGQVLP